MNKLAVLESTLPLKAYPKEKLNEILLGKFDGDPDCFVVWVSDLLGLRDETSAKRLILSMGAIKDACWSMGFIEIKKMFEMYVDGKLIYEDKQGELFLKPITNYFDRALFGQIKYEYNKRIKIIEIPTEKDYEQEKRDSDMLYVVQLFDYFIQNRRIPNLSVWVYDYLDAKELINYTPKEKILLYKLGKEQKLTDDEAKLKSKIVLIRRYFERLEAKDKHIKDEL